MGMSIYIRGHKLSRDEIDSHYTYYEEKTPGAFLAHLWMLRSEHGAAKRVCERYHLDDLIEILLSPSDGPAEEILAALELWRPPNVVAAAFRRLVGAIAAKDLDMRILAAEVIKDRGYSENVDQFLEFATEIFGLMAKQCDKLAEAGEDRIQLEYE